MKKKSRRQRIAESRVIEKPESDIGWIPFVVFGLLFTGTVFYMFWDMI